MRIADKSGDLILICVYAPTETGPNDEKEVFYKELERTYDKLPNYCSKILLGDFNAQVENETMYKPTVGGESAHDISNGNGMRLIERCKSLKNGYKPAIYSLTNEKRDLIMNSKDIAEEFKNYFNNMLNNNNNKESEIVQGDSQEEEEIIIHGTEESTELQPSSTEIDLTILSLKNNKAAGEDGIFGEFLKIGV
ncbi:hypothetical protein QTP88_016560 [Uroleucon formosanum]